MSVALALLQFHNIANVPAALPRSAQPGGTDATPTSPMLDLNAAMGGFATFDTGRLITDAVTQYAATRKAVDDGDH